jgi:hypothetical protein
MRRLVLVTALASAPFVAAVARAEEPMPAPAPAPAPKIASDEEAAAAIAKFKAAFKGNDADRKTMALFALAKTQHPLVVAELGKALANRNETVRTAAAMAFQDLTALPGLAGERLVASLEANKDDAVYLMTAIDGIEAVGYRGALPQLVALFKHKNGAVVKHAILSVARTKDIRAIEQLLLMMKEAKIEDGYSWQGGEVTVDTGAPGTADQEAAEAQYNQQYGNNGSKSKSSAKKVRDIGQILLLAMKDLTGEQFKKTSEARAWVEKNKDGVEARKKALDDEAKAQQAAADAQAKPKK